MYPLKFTDVKTHFFESPDDIPEKDIENGSEIEWREFYSVRNALLSALRIHGSVGPMLECIIDDSIEDDDPDFLDNDVNKDYIFYVTDDMLYDKWRVHEVEIENQDNISDELIESIWRVLYTYPKWAVKVYVPHEIYIYVELNNIYVAGKGLSKIRPINKIINGKKST